MASKKINKELKAPDQFVSFWGRAGSWLRGAKAVAWRLAGLVALVALGWGLQAAEGRAESASRAFARIHRVATVPLAPAAGETPAPEAAAPDPDLPKVKTEKERLEAALKEADTFLGSTAAARCATRPCCSRPVTWWPWTGPGTPCRSTRSWWDRSISRLRFLALEGLAYAQEASGQLDKAVAAFSRLADHAQGVRELLTATGRCSTRPGCWSARARPRTPRSSIAPS